MPLLRNAGLLRHFLAVTQAGSLSGAAQVLAVSQPALTKSIRRLEQHYGVALFERRARGMMLTPFGETLLARPEPHDGHRATLEHLAQRVRERMCAQPVEVSGLLLPVTTSIGVAVAGEGEDGVALIRRADDALYRAKAAGRNCVEMG